jgi:hypothetical protein
LEVEGHTWRYRINVVRYLVVVFENELLSQSDCDFGFGERFVRLVDLMVRRKNRQ